MRKTFATIAIAASFLLFLAVVAYAGIGGTKGLPGVNVSGLWSGDNNYYNVTGNDNVVGNRGSVMCIACHTRNPAMRTAYRNDNGWRYVGSHFVTRTFADTSEGGGYSDGSGTKTRANRLSNRFYTATSTTAWATNPRYGYLNAGAIDNGTDPNTFAAQMICESCHNIVRNIGPRKLLAYGFANDNSALCVGCHGDMDASINAEWQLHPIDNVSITWTGTQHHRNSHSVQADTLYYGAATQQTSAAHNLGRLDRAYYTQGVQMWGANYGELGASARAIDWTTNSKKVVDLSGTDNNQIRPQNNPQSNFVVACTNCHRAHNAVSSAGATILMSGTDTTEIGTAAVPSAETGGWRAVLKMDDRGGRAAAFNSTNALCLACHK